jgi:hypothetical protein
LRHVSGPCLRPKAMRATLPWLCLLVLTALGHGSPARALDSAQVLEQCADLRLPPAPPGIDALRRRCPDLENAVLDLGLADQLGTDWRSRINGTAVAGFARLLERYRAPPLSNAPQLDSLPQVMLALQANGAHKSRWQLIKDWLSSLLRQPQQNIGWLQRLLAQLNLSPLPARVFGYAAIAAVLSLALWIVWRELKVVGALARRPERGAMGMRRPVPKEADDLAVAPDLDALAPWQRPAALLAALIQALRQSGRLGLERALTHRQLGERGTFDDPAQRMRFDRVSLLAERVLYGPYACSEPDSQIAQALADGLALHGQLRAPPAVQA